MRLGLLSLVCGALLFVGCTDKGEQKGEEAAKRAVTSSVTQSSASAPAPSHQFQDPLPGVAAPASKAQKPQPQTQESGKSQSQASSQPQQASAARGAQLYAKCAGCHGPKGERKALGKSAPIGGMAKEEILRKLKGYQAGTLNLYGMGGLMKGQLAGLSEADLEALAEYISSLK
ncbi:MAG: hypothetical protein C6I00_06115 [Nitratiruptor sp.]|nr:hypothetical protein [Nitratiruptor sp.]NPA83018.1 c-type cytochrome [Campylobacterota bacterium]